MVFHGETRIQYVNICKKKFIQMSQRLKRWELNNHFDLRVSRDELDIRLAGCRLPNSASF